MITIIDYGMGNLRSVSKALDHLGMSNEISGDPKKLKNADRVILPGVGAFGDAMEELKSRHLIEPMAEYLATGRPMMGICLGLQLIMEWSEESPGVEGLGYIPGGVKRFQISEKVPHMGWNTVGESLPDCPLFANMKDESHFYFVHSFCVAPEGEAGRACVAGVTHYGVDFPSVIWRDNLVATQFHPEKSQHCGLAMLTAFGRM